MIRKAKNRLEPAQLLPAEIRNQSPESVGEWGVKAVQVVLGGDGVEVDSSELLAFVAVKRHIDGIVVDKYGRKWTTFSVVTGHQVEHKVEIRLI